MQNLNTLNFRNPNAIIDAYFNNKRILVQKFASDRPFRFRESPHQICYKTFSFAKKVYKVQILAQKVRNNFETEKKCEMIQRFIR